MSSSAVMIPEEVQRDAGASTDSCADHAALVQQTETLTANVARLTEENGGLAEELLRCYEQLNLIFHVTERAAELADVSAMVAELMGDLGSLLAVQEAWFVTYGDTAVRLHLVREPDGDLERSAHWVDPPCRLPDAAAATAESEEAPAAVEAVTPHLLVAAVTSGGERLGTAVLRRDRDAEEFVSGEMLVAESVLRYAGHVLQNIQLYENLKRMSVEVVRALVNAIDQKDHYTSGHSDRVGYFSRMIGEAAGLRPSELETLEWAGLLHDVGKIGIREGILSKPAKLTDEEFAEIKLHPRMSYEVLKPIASFREVLSGALFHHENYDGTGYPFGLKGDDIPLFGRIIHIADLFDALTSARSYRAAFSWDEAIEIVETEAGTKLDPTLAAAFLHGIRTLDPETRAALQRASVDECGVPSELAPLSAPSLAEQGASAESEAAPTPNAERGTQ